MGLQNGVWREGLKNGAWNGIYEKRELFKRGRGREKREGRDWGGGREDKGIHITGGRVGEKKKNDLNLIYLSTCVKQHTSKKPSLLLSQVSQSDVSLCS